MKYLESYGAVWQLSDRSYKRLLTDAASGKMCDVTDYGKQVCPLNQCSAAISAISCMLIMLGCHGNSANALIRYEDGELTKVKP